MDFFELEFSSFPDILLESLSLSLSVTGFEQASCHKSYGHKELNASNIHEREEAYTSSAEPSEESPILADTLITALWDTD